MNIYFGWYFVGHETPQPHPHTIYREGCGFVTYELCLHILMYEFSLQTLKNLNLLQIEIHV